MENQSFAERGEAFSFEGTQEEFFREMEAYSEKNPSYAIKEAFPVLDILYRSKKDVTKFRAGRISQGLPKLEKAEFVISILRDEEYNLKITVRGTDTRQEIFARAKDPQKLRDEIIKTRH